jgi:hypothetical protein
MDGHDFMMGLAPSRRICFSRVMTLTIYRSPNGTAPAAPTVACMGHLNNCANNNANFWWAFA